MRKIIIIVCLLTLTLNVFAKKVKFAVDMTGQVISPNGIHVTGDFQTIAGFPGGNWASNTTPCTQEDTTGIYSIVVDIPAFAKYEYKFVNGDQFYEVEFVPVESRVGYNFNDNRWIYVDSLADDTTFLGNILFGGNAPAGLTLVRFIVDMQNMTVSAAGVHVAGNFQGWDAEQTILYSFGSAVYEVISYVTAGTYEYKFYNGNAVGTEETVPVNCAVNNNREVQVSADVVLPVICFNACVACSLTGVIAVADQKIYSLVPNPAAQYSLLRFNTNGLTHTVYITDVTGRIVRTYPDSSQEELRIEKDNLDDGIYFLTIHTGPGSVETHKLIFQ